MARIALSMIAKNEAATLRECLESVAEHVDEIVFVDTGSDDETVEIAKEFTDKVLHFDWTGNFAEARQFALDNVSDDCDWLAWMDADDVVEGAENWRKLADEAPEKVDGILFEYDYAQDPQTGTTMTRLWRERLMRDPKAWRWQGLVHEVLVRVDGRHPAYMSSNACIYRHRRPATKNVPERNLKIIEDYLAKCGEDDVPPEPRMLVYHGSELMAQGRHKDAIPSLHRYLSVSNWDEEKYQAYHKLADCYRALGMYDDAIVTDLKGLQLRDDWADGYFGVAECYYHKKEWDRVIRWSERGFALGQPQTLLITHPLDYLYTPRVFYAIALFNTGRMEEALQVTEEALEVVPHDPNLQHNRNAYAELIRCQKTIEAALHLASELVVHDEPLKACDVLDRLPHNLQHHPQILDARTKTRHLIPMAFEPMAYDEFYEWNPFTPLPVETQEEVAQNIPRFRKLIEEADSFGRPLRILDIGCNDGLLATELAKRGHEVVGLDLNPTALDHCRERAAHWGVEDKVEFVRSVVEDYDGADFDIVASFEVVEHVLNVEAFLESALSKLAPGGRLVLSSPDGVIDRASRETLGLQPREHLRVVTRVELTSIIDRNAYGEVLTSERTPDGLSYVSFQPYAVGEKHRRHVTIWCPFSYEEWGPHTLEKGIGGSEEAVVHLARELKELGHRVTVYGGVEGAYDGVLYHAHQMFDPFEPRDIVVLWRTPVPVDYRLTAKETYVWLHDIPVAAEYTPERLARIDGIFVLSEWHRNCLAHVPDDKIIRSRNGVHLLPAPEEPRSTRKVVWGSSPDRGLDILLSIWDEVVEQVPDAELHCYYGFDMYDKLGRPPDFKQKVMAIVDKHDSIHWHGRVGEQELWDAFSTAGIWAYPTYFDEISCITAMRAQITGAWPVVVPRAALDETVQYGTKVDVDSITEDTSVEQFKEALIAELTEPVTDEVRSTMMAWASDHYGWASVASEWSERFQPVKEPVLV